MTKSHIYILGPMRGYENYNFDAFDQAKAYLEDLDYTVVSPADLDRLYEGWEKYPPKTFIVTPAKKREMIRRDLEAVMNCECVYALRRWEKSKGSAIEMALAKFLDLEIILEQ